MSEIKGNIICKSSTKDIAKVESNGKVLDLELAEVVKKYNAKGLEAGEEYYIIYNDETNIIVYAKKQISRTSKSNLKSYESKPEVKVVPKGKIVNSLPKDINDVFGTLSKIKCKIEKKGKYNYVTWTDAWEEIMNLYPNSSFKVYENSDGFPAFVMKGVGAFVKIGVTINEVEHIEHYPVLDYGNNAISDLKLNVFDINKSIKRGMVKALAYFGLGLYVYKGEELPEEESKK